MTRRLRSFGGFTIPEILVSFFVLTLGIVTATTLVTHLLRSTRVTREELLATNIAREGLEVLRNVRDTNWKANSGSQRDADEAREHWNNGFDDALASTDGATFIPVLATGDVRGVPQPLWTLLPAEDCALGDRDEAAAHTQLYRGADGRFEHPCDAVAPDDAGRTQYRRELQVVFLDATTPEELPTTDPARAKIAWARVTVEWYGNADASTWNEPIGVVQLETTLTDWFGRREKATITP